MSHAKGIVLIFEDNIHDEHVEEVIKAAKMWQGVIDARPVSAESGDVLIALRERTELAKRLFDLGKELLK